MKKLFSQKVTTTLLTLFITTLVFTSCSSDDDKDPQVVFTSLSANKTDAFIEDIIVLNLEGTGYTDVNIASNNTSVKINKVTSTIYEISSTIAASTNIYVALSNNTYKEHKSVTLNFHEHGVKNSNTTEGIKFGIDKSSKVLSLLGEPNQKSTSTSGLVEFWIYSSKGLSVAITKSTNIVGSISLFSSNYFINQENGTKLSYTNYPYEIGNGWKINTTTMDAIITKWGAPTEKISSSDPSSTLRTYRYASQNMYISFYANTVDDYTGKLVKSVLLY